MQVGQSRQRAGVVVATELTWADAEVGWEAEAKARLSSDDYDDNTLDASDDNCHCHCRCPALDRRKLLPSGDCNHCKHRLNARRWLFDSEDEKRQKKRKKKEEEQVETDDGSHCWR